MTEPMRDTLARLILRVADLPSMPDDEDEFTGTTAHALADAIIGAGWLSPEQWREDRREGERVATDLMTEVAKLGPERDRLAATVERIRVLCDEGDATDGYCKPAGAVRTDDLRAALDGESTSELLARARERSARVAATVAESQDVRSP